MENLCDSERCKLVDKKDKKKKKQECEDPEQAQEQGHGQLLVADCQDNSISSSMQSMSVASCSDQGNHEVIVAANASAAASTALSSSKEKYKVEVVKRSGRIALSRPVHWWGDCAPNVALLREALLSAAPGIAVLGPLHGCFAFYMAHLHNEVLSSAYARTMTLGPDVTRLEAAFMWVGGWRPTSALVMVYSLMGIDIENALQAVSAGRDIGECSTSSVLSSRQLSVMDTLQKHTQHAEMKISKKLTLLQMLIGDQDVLAAVLLDAASSVANDSSRFILVTEKRMSRFRRLLVQAEELRLHTLKDLLSLLTPIQAARCGVGVFEMCSSFRSIGTELLSSLRNVPMSSVPIVAFCPLPAPPSSLPLDRIMVVAGFGEAIVSAITSSDLPNSLEFPLCQSREPLVSDFSSSDDSILKLSDVPVNKSNEHPLVSNGTSSSEILTVSDVLLRQSDETSHLVPSCSNSSPSSQPLPEDSSQDLHKDERSRSFATIDQPQLELGIELELESNDDTTDGIVHTAVEQRAPRAGNTNDREIISNRLLLLSPASSNVAIQNCSLDTAELGPYFEMHPQLRPKSNDTGEAPHQEQSATSESGDVGESWQKQLCSRSISVPRECAEQGLPLGEGKEV